MRPQQNFSGMEWPIFIFQANEKNYFEIHIAASELNVDSETKQGRVPVP